MRSRRWRTARARRATSSASVNAGGVVTDGSAPPSCAPTLDSGGAPPDALRLDGGCCMLLTLIAHQHLIAQLHPDRLVDAGELWKETNLRDIARSRQIDAVGSLDRSRSCGDD